MTDPRWELPGPRRFAEGLAGALSGRSHVAVAAPAGLDTGALRRAVRDRSSALVWMNGHVEELEGRPPLQALLTWLDIRVPVTRAPNESDLAEARELTGHVLWLDGYEGLSAGRRAEWRAFLVRYARASRRDDDHRPLLVVLSAIAPDAGDLDLDDPAIRVAYWWGTLSRLDLAIYIDASAPEMPALERAVAVEVAGFDLDLADRLADAHGLDLAAVEALVDDYAVERGLAALEPGAEARPCRDDEPAANLAAWAAGQVDRFDGVNRLFVHSAACGVQTRSAMLHRRIWRGQITTLLPELEIWRADLITLAKVRGYVAAGVAPESLDFRELHEHLNRTRDEPARRRLADLAGELRWARNRIAHLDLLSASAVTKLRADAACELGL